MYVVRDKITKKVIYIDYSGSSRGKAAEEIYPEFDPDKLELGWTDTRHIPAEFNINNNGEIQPKTIEERIDAGTFQMGPEQKLVRGKIVNKSKAELVNEGLLQLDEVRQDAINYYSDLAFQKRRELIPDYKVQNAALGIYDDDRIADYKATVKAFRDEFYRVKEMIEKAGSVKEIESIVPNFPEAIRSTAKPKAQKKARRVKGVKKAQA